MTRKNGGCALCREETYTYLGPEVQMRTTLDTHLETAVR